MAEPGKRRAKAIVRYGWWPGWIWAIPLAALGIVVWLGVRAFVDRGPMVDVTFENAAGVAAGNTKVQYKGLVVGEVEGVDLSPDLGHVTMHLRMDGNVEKLLTEGTRFWIVGAPSNPLDLSALKTIVSGPYLEMDPGPGKPARHFTGLTQPPAIRSGTPGTAFVLHGTEAGSLHQGTAIYYLGLEVGKVTSVRMTGDRTGFDFDIFIDAPYDKLVHPGTRFWDAGALLLSTGAEGIRAKLLSVDALLTGAVAFTTPQEEAATPASKPGDRFTLYKDEGAALGAPHGPTVRYLLRFAGAVGDLRTGAPVKLRGFRIGEVVETSLAYDAWTDRLETPVIVAIEPARLKLEGVSPPPDGNWSRVMNDVMAAMVRDGLRARLEKDPPLVGGATVVFDFVSEAPAASLSSSGGVTEIPTQPGGDIASLTASASAAMTKIANLPLTQIADDIRDAAAHLDTVAASPALAESLTHLDDTLARLDRVTREASGKIGPLIDSLRKTADAAQASAAAANQLVGGGIAGQGGALPAALHEMTEAARSIRALANYLDRHPEALLQGRGGSGE